MGTCVASTLRLLQITRDMMVHISEPLLPILEYTPRSRIARSYGNSAPAPPLNLFLTLAPNQNMLIICLFLQAAAVRRLLLAK